MGSMFNRRNKTYKLKYFQQITTETNTTAQFGLEVLSYCSEQLRSLLPEKMR